MTLETPQQIQNPVELYNGLSVAHRAALDDLHNRKGLAPLENLFEMFAEDFPGDTRASEKLQEIASVDPSSEEFRSKVLELFKLIS